jgi:hypothetical protein
LANPFGIETNAEEVILMNPADESNSPVAGSMELIDGEMKITIDGKTVCISEAETVAAVKMWLAQEKQKVGGKGK